MVIESMLNGTLDETRKKLELLKIALQAEKEIYEEKQLEYETLREMAIMERNKKIDDTISPKYYSSVCLLIKNENCYLNE